MSEDELAGWHHYCNGHELGRTPGGGEGQGGLTYYSPQDREELDMTGRLNNSNTGCYGGYKEEGLYS